VTAISEILRNFEDGTEVFGIAISGRAGLREVGLALVLLLILLLRPKGIMGSVEVDWPRGRTGGTQAGDVSPGPPAEPSGVVVYSSKPLRQVEDVGR